MSKIIAMASSVRFVLEGEETYVIDGRSRRLRAGEFIIVDEGVESVAKTAADATGFCVYLPFHAPDGARGFLGSPAIIGSSIDPLATLIRAYASAVAAGEARTVPENLIGLVSNGVEDFMCGFSKKRARLSHARGTSKTDIVERVERVRAFMHAHADTPLTLDDLAKEACLSRFHLARTFSEVHAVPPLRYHRSLRMEAAAKKLAHATISPTELAADLGYATLSAFTRAFRRRYGVPPSEYASQPMLIGRQTVE